jgi:phage-related protein
MTDLEKRFPVRFYRTASGREPVRDWLKELAPEDRRTLGEDLKTVEYGWPIGMPLCRCLHGDLWEVRSNLSDRRIARVLFCVTNSQIVLVHGFIKKTQSTPKSDLALARQRMKEVLS